MYLHDVAQRQPYFYPKLDATNIVVTRNSVITVRSGNFVLRYLSRITLLTVVLFYITLLPAAAAAFSPP